MTRDALQFLGDLLTWLTRLEPPQVIAVVVVLALAAWVVVNVFGTLVDAFVDLVRVAFGRTDKDVQAVADAVSELAEKVADGTEKADGYGHDLLQELEGHGRTLDEARDSADADRGKQLEVLRERIAKRLESRTPQP